MLLVHASLRPSAIHGLVALPNPSPREVIWSLTRGRTSVCRRELAALPQIYRAYYAKYGYAEMAEGRKVITLWGSFQAYEPCGGAQCPIAQRP